MTKRVNVLGVGISVLNMASAMERITEALRARRKGYVCLRDAHGVMLAQKDESFRRILNNAFLCTPDGMPMVWLGRWNGHREMSRVYGPDLMLEICAWSEKNSCRHFFFGGVPGVAELLVEKLKNKFPKLEVAGTYTPPFRALNVAEERELQELVRAARPDIFWVGLSTPKQEKFMAEFLPKLDVTLMIGVGAAFDFHAGRIRQAPRWMQRSGLEWLFRLVCEPRRLGKRYLKNNPLFLWKIAGQISGLKKYSID